MFYQVFNNYDLENLLYIGVEKSQLSKQKSNGSKRGDKKNIKVPSKTKFDSSSTKLGATVINSASGGNNFFGIFLGI